MMKSNKVVVWFFSFILVSCTIGSCDNTLEPLDRNNGIFAIYGVLDLGEDTQYIRVRDLHVPFTKEATANIDATVTLQNLTLGTSTRLESERREHQDVYQHNFVIRNRVYDDHEYKLAFEKSNGAAVELNFRTPTQPEPHFDPLNQNCYVPIDLTMDPMNGGTLVIRFALRRDRHEDDNNPWGPPHIIKSDEQQSQGKITFTFTPHDEMIDILRFPNPSDRCNQHLKTGNIYMSFIHYGPGFYEQLTREHFDIVASTQQFGSLYYDTLAVPVDTSLVCPQDC